MNRNYICPKCEGRLLVGGFVILTVTTKDNKRGLILLSPQLGDYTRVIHPSFQIEKGEEVDFSCPLCQSNLGAHDVDKRLVRLILIDENSEKHEIFFSGIEGEKCTYQISEKRYEKFGSSWEIYDMYFRTRRV